MTAKKYGGLFNLRYDDTNPSKEDVEYVDAIKEDIEWLGFKWANVYYASEYFDFIYECAIKLIEKGKASGQLSNSEIMEAIGHEQYAYDYYGNYLPDYFERLETCCRIPTELGYAPVFFQDGIFGNTAWGN